MPSGSPTAVAAVRKRRSVLKATGYHRNMEPTYYIPKETEIDSSLKMVHEVLINLLSLKNRREMKQQMQVNATSNGM